MDRVESARGGAGGRGVMKVRSLLCARPLSALAPVTVTRYVALGASGRAMRSRTAAYGGGVLGFTP
jgi:hypothetical protein